MSFGELANGIVRGFSIVQSGHKGTTPKHSSTPRPSLSEELPKIHKEL